MSVKATNWAWHQAPEEIAGNDLIVLMALADIADDDGDVVHGDPRKHRQEVLAEKSRVSLATFKRSVASLVDDYHVLAVRRTGRENRYKLKLDVVRPPKPAEAVDNSLETVDGRSLNMSYRASDELSDSSAVSQPIEHLNQDLKIQSSLEVTTDARALRADGDVSQPRLGIADRLRSAGARRHLNVLELNDKLTEYFEDIAGHENVRRVIYLVARAILGKAAHAKTDLSDPTRYVIAAVRREPEVWRKYAFTLDPRA